MAFIKVVKTKAYYKRFQTRFRRRREGKTDYYARKRLIIQDKNKYNTPKYRLVTRLTCSNVICQVIYATIQGDVCFVRADSNELKKWGLTAGLTNYAAAYCTGLLVARRLLRKVGMDAQYKGAAKVDGEDYSVEKDHAEGQKKPFKAVLDVGLTRTTTGNKVFACLKGACDGGLNVPHSTRRFPGYKSTEKGESYNAKIHRERIFGLHVDKYMKLLKKEPKKVNTQQFNKWNACLTVLKLDSLEKVYSKIHEEIRKNPDRQPKKEFKGKIEYKDARKTIVVTTRKDKNGAAVLYRKDRKLTHKERKENIAKKIKAAVGKKGK
jgi:large subunit ribosomal protein L5e